VEQHIGNVGAGHARLLHVIVVPRQQQPLLTCRPVDDNP
jgi:hypothetical protein